MALSDSDIREPLFEFLEKEYGIIRIIEEKNAGRARADAVMVCESALFGIEIKSDADTYARLPKQVRYYNQYFDRNYIVAGTSHAKSVSEHVPSFWGIITAEKTDAGMDFYIVRKPLANPKMKPEKKLSLLWRPELAAIQKKYGMPAYKQKSAQFVRDKILERLDIMTLNMEISDALFERDYTLIEEQIAAYKKENRK